MIGTKLVYNEIMAIIPMGNNSSDLVYFLKCYQNSNVVRCLDSSLLIFLAIESHGCIRYASQLNQPANLIIAIFNPFSLKVIAVAVQTPISCPHPITASKAARNGFLWHSHRQPVYSRGVFDFDEFHLACCCFEWVQVASVMYHWQHADTAADSLCCEFLLFSNQSAQSYQCVHNWDAKKPMTGQCQIRHFYNGYKLTFTLTFYIT